LPDFIPAISKTPLLSVTADFIKTESFERNRIIVAAGEGFPVLSIIFPVTEAVLVWAKEAIPDKTKMVKAISSFITDFRVNFWL
jgi:hypothetical protein